ncbi:MAG: hypothetical protein AB7O43_01985 [Hyphomicrobiaceae bacterium]
MRLIDDLRRRLAVEESYFRQHLIKEDVARLERVMDIFSSHPERSAFLRDALMVGWTPDNLRTFELKSTLEPLLAVIHQRLSADGDDAAAYDDEIARLWQAFEADRMGRLVGCLSRVPPPV